MLVIYIVDGPPLPTRCLQYPLSCLSFGIFTGCPKPQQAAELFFRFEQVQANAMAEPPFETYPQLK